MPRLFTRGTSLYETEVMMVTIPNFKPRTSGTHTYRRIKDKEAGKCIYCEDYTKKTGCKHVYCPYILERAEMGSIDYAGLLKESFSKINKRKFKNRIAKLAQTFNGDMFLSSEHKYRFYSELRKLRTVCSNPNNRYLSALYLLTTSSKLWSMISEQVYANTIDFEKVKLKEMNTDSYTYYQMSQSVYTHIHKIEFDEIIDEEIVEDTVFKILIHSQLVERYGANILQIRIGGLKCIK